MSFLNSLISKINRKIKQKRILASVSFIVLILFGWVIVRSCSSQESLNEHLYRVARDSTWYPLQLLGRERYMQGFTTDLLMAIAKEENFKLEILNVGPNQLKDNLEREWYDGMLSSLMPDVLNQEKYAFSNPFYLTGPVLIVLKDSTVDSLRDLENRRLGVKSGSRSILTLSGSLGIDLVTYENLNTAIEDLIKNRIDGVLMDSVIAQTYIQNFYASKLKVVTSPLNKEGLRLVALRNAYGEHLVEKFNEGLKKLRENGEYRELLKKWELVHPDLEIEEASEVLDQLTYTGSTSNVPLKLAGVDFRCN